jgi:hypothetical protein
LSILQLLRFAEVDEEARARKWEKTFTHNRYIYFPQPRSVIAGWNWQLSPSRKRQLAASLAGVTWQVPATFFSPGATDNTTTAAVKVDNASCQTKSEADIHLNIQRDSASAVIRLQAQSSLR